VNCVRAHTEPVPDSHFGSLSRTIVEFNPGDDLIRRRVDTDYRTVAIGVVGPRSAQHPNTILAEGQP
jgi:hypothetical protein